MAKPRVYVVYGLGIGCHQEAAHAYKLAGALPEIVHIRQLLSGEKRLSEAQILNMSGGFLHGDMGDAGMYAANEIEHASVMEGDEMRRFKDIIIKFAQDGNVVYGQCNGFQVLVKTGLLPGINGDYSRQTVTLTGNDCGNYWVAPVMHTIEQPGHFAFRGMGDSLTIWCRHGEGKLVFWSEYGLLTREEAESNRKIVNERHVLMRYANPATKKPTMEFPDSPNGSDDSIAGLVDSTGNIFAHMAHTEVGVYASRDADFFARKDALRRKGVRAASLEGRLMEGPCMPVFRNLVGRFE